MNYAENSSQSYTSRDAAVNWHPYTQMQTSPAALPIVRGQGSLLYDETGKSYIDAISSWWVNLHGHGHPHLAEKIHAQVTTLDHVVFAGFTHPGAIELSERLLAILPANQRRVFYSDNGSTAVEAAIKMAVQYWHNQGRQKNTILYLEGGYHGDTFGCMAVAERGLFTRAFQPLLFAAQALPVPTAANIEEVLNRIDTAAETKEVAAIIFEPLIQAAGGFRFHSPNLLDAVIKRCREHAIVTIADEVMTGFGRTGTLFACDQLQENPDIICLAKGITGGTMPLAVTTCAAFIYDAFLADDRAKAFFHGHSYTANPVSCAAAGASLDLLLSPRCLAQRQGIQAFYESAPVKTLAANKLKNARALGTVFAAELPTMQASSYLNEAGAALATLARSRGVLLRPLGNTVYVMPPYCISTSELTTIFAAIEEFLNAN